MRLTKNQKLALNCLADVERWHEKPRDQGQTVRAEWGCTEDFIYCRSYDRSDRTETVSAYQWPADVQEHDGSFEPWNGSVRTGRRVGRIK